MNSGRSAEGPDLLAGAAPGSLVMGRERTLLGAVDELDAVLEELARHVEDLLELVGHCEG